MDPPDVMSSVGRQWLTNGFYLAAQTYVAHDVCVWCGGDGGTIEHITPHALGGRGIWNQAAACGRCNSRRGTASILLWLLALKMERGSTAMAARRIAIWTRQNAQRHGIKFRN